MMFKFIKRLMEIKEEQLEIEYTKRRMLSEIGVQIYYIKQMLKENGKNKR